MHYNKDRLILQHNLARFGYQFQTVLQQYFLMRTFRHANAILTRIFIDINVIYRRLTLDYWTLVSPNKWTNANPPFWLATLLEDFPWLSFPQTQIQNDRWFLRSKFLNSSGVVKAAFSEWNLRFFIPRTGSKLWRHCYEQCYTWLNMKHDRCASSQFQTQRKTAKNSFENELWGI